MAKGLLCNFAVLVVLIVVLGVAVTPVSAQVPTGTVNGLISDPREAVVPNARVVAISRAQGVSRETLSNANGLYVIADLAPGDYDLKIEASGFAVSEFTGVNVQAGRTITLDAKLQIAGVGTTVNVNEGAGEVDLTQSMIQGQITST